MSFDEKKEISIDDRSLAEDTRPDHLHEYMKAGLSQEDAQFLHDVPTEQQSKIFHKVDWKLCPMLAVMYLISHLDRANIG